MSHLSVQLLTAVREMSQLDFLTLPSVQFVGKLRQALIRGGYASEAAEALTARVEIQLPLGELTPSEIDELAQHYAGFILKMREAYQHVGIQDVDAFMLRMASALTLKAG